MLNDKTVPAALLRMHFHDCFIRGCDGSVLLEGNDAVEESCPRLVSCADILALAARDVVALSGGPTWDVPQGRKDARSSKSSDMKQLPAPTFNISQLQKRFSQRGLSMDDLFALSDLVALHMNGCIIKF
ncbi:hypothetical protein ACFE04_028620 [Oxalis oulophora]